MVRSKLRKKAVFYPETEYAIKQPEAFASEAIQILSSVSVKAGAANTIVLNATVNWQTSSLGNKNTYTEITFKIWRGSTLPENLICSAKDSCRGIEKSKITTLAHVDIYFEASKEIVYILTAETLKSGYKPKNMNCMTFTAEPT